MTLRYHDSLFPTTVPSYTGNISEWTFRHAGGNSHTYAFSYDALSRLSGTKQYINATADDRFVEKGLTYDLNGNILTLQRTAAGKLSDNLAYSYAGNRLSALTGSSQGPTTTTTAGT